MSNDYLARDVGDKIVSYIKSNNGDKVIALDGAWGSGKTHLCKKINETLKQDGYKSVVLDAFEHDYHNDAMIVLAGVLANFETDNDEKEKLYRKFASKMVPILKTSAKVFTGALVKKITSINISDDEYVDGIAKEIIGSAEASIYNEIKSFGKMDESVKGIQTLISTISSESTKGLVVIVDDLDRCRPSFALELIEKIKHVFECERVTFILSMNQEQIYHSISHIYGMSNDLSRIYLNKFVSRRFYLAPVSNYSNGNQVSDNKAYIYSEDLLYQTGYFSEISHASKEVNPENTIKMCASILSFNDLTLRDIDGIVHLFDDIMMSLPEKDLDLAGVLVAFSCAVIKFRNESDDVLKRGVRIEDIISRVLNRGSDSELKSIPLMLYMIDMGCGYVYALYCTPLDDLVAKLPTDSNPRINGFYELIQRNCIEGGVYGKMSNLVKNDFHKFI